MSQNLVLGKKGEGLAVKYLQKQGFKILEVNFRTKFGEIDIIAKDKKTLVFIEVKTRLSCKFGLPEDAITPAKIKSLKKVIDFYCLTHQKLLLPMRIDLVGIIFASEERIERINHCKNIS